jgi:hypothetical protein
MKPLQVAPLTEEDSRIWTRGARYAYDGSFFLARHQDRRDAELMRWLTRFTERHYHPDMKIPLERVMPAAHMWLRLDPEWPVGHYVIDIT